MSSSALKVVTSENKNIDPLVINQITQTRDVYESMLADEELLVKVTEAAYACVKSLKSGGKMLLAGNGGSAADAQHIAGELVSRFAFDRPGLPAGCARGVPHQPVKGG